MQNIIHVTDHNFEQEVLNSEVPVILDVWAPWCMPCRMVAPVLEEIAADYQGQLKIAKLNADENMMAAQLGVMSIPTLIFYQKGKIVDTIVGAVPRQMIEERLKQSVFQNMNMA